MRKRGIALFLTMGFTALLVMMLVATMTSVHGGNIFAQDYHRKTAAIYAAESGLAYLQERLEQDPGWTTNIEEKTTFGTGEFSIKFAPGGASVNNLEGDKDPLPSRYGDVRPGTAFVQVEGRALGQTAVIECIIGRKSEDFLKAAIAASGKVYLGGNVKVSGHTSSEDLTEAPADIISNYDKDAPWGDGKAPVSWDSTGDIDSKIWGSVRAASPAGNSITNNLKLISEGSITDHATITLDNVNIKREISLKSNAAPFDASNLNPSNQDYYAGTSREITGDIVLDNARLYIRGDLTVHGSIKGTGAVYVSGDTTLSGDAEVVANEDGVVIFSHGNVQLKGFGATEWMNSVTENSPEWQKTKLKMKELREGLEAVAAGDDTAVTPPSASEHDYWASPAGLALAVLATEIVPHSWDSSPAPSNLLYKMIQEIRAEPEGRTRNFVLKKFSALRDPRDPMNPTQDRIDTYNPPYPPGAPTRVNIHGALGINYGTPPASADTVLPFLSGATEGKPIDRGLQLELYLYAGFLKTGAVDPFYAGVTPEGLRKALTKHAHWLELMDEDRLGTSYFQGNVYTRGAFYSSNEVTIIGSLSAVADPDEIESAHPWEPVSGVELKPGDVYLGNGTRIEYVNDLMPGPRVSTPSVGVVHWLR